MTAASLYLISCLAFAAVMLDGASLRDRLVLVLASLLWPLALAVALLHRLRLRAASNGFHWQRTRSIRQSL